MDDWASGYIDPGRLEDAPPEELPDEDVADVQPEGDDDAGADDEEV